MSTGSLSPSPWFTGIDDDGSLLVGGLLYTYAAGTTTPQATYTDVGLTVPNANPVVLDAAARATLFLSATSYKFVLKRSDGSTVRTQDNIASVAAGSAAGGGLGEVFSFDGDGNSPVSVTAYPVGFTFDKLHAGTGVWSLDSANLPAGTYALEAMIKTIDGIITMSVALVNLDDGSPDTPIVAISSISLTGALVQSSAITFATAGAAKRYGIKSKVSSQSGFAWGIRIVRVA